MSNQEPKQELATACRPAVTDTPTAGASDQELNQELATTSAGASAKESP